MKFDYGAVENEVDDIKKELNKINNALEKIKEGIDFMKSTSHWNSITRDYYEDKCEELYPSLENVEILSKNITGYLDGVLSNYKQMDQSLEDRIKSLLGW